MTDHIVLYQPEIPANTGNIVRMCASVNTRLRLVEPLGFRTDDKILERVSLDYWEFVNVTHHDSIEAFFEVAGGEYYLLTEFSKKTYSDFNFSNHDKDFYSTFGKETTGLPDWVEEKYRGTTLRTPTNEHIYSLNLSNTAVLLIYEALRQ